METTIPVSTPEVVTTNDGSALHAAIAEIVTADTLLVGIGNNMRGDDGAGPCLIEIIADYVSVPCINAGSVPENYLEKMVMLHPETIIFIDAADFLGIPGEIKLFGHDAICRGACSTHTGSMALITAYLQHRMPSTRICIIAVQPQSIMLNGSISNEVRRAITRLTSIFMQVFPHA
ncbi:MAG: hydrogenase maturation protease [Chitinispirillaceae bacterium]|nr:hydrogenase maturation protease [Chitinispirillaceae bacterium]